MERSGKGNTIARMVSEEWSPNETREVWRFSYPLEVVAQHPGKPFDIMRRDPESR